MHHSISILPRIYCQGEQIYNNNIVTAANIIPLVLTLSLATIDLINLVSIFPFHLSTPAPALPTQPF